MHKMKPLLAIFILLIAQPTLAQFKKGMRMTGGNIGSVFFNSGNTDVTFPSPTTGYSVINKGFGLNLAASYGKFSSENSVIGLTLNIGPSSNKSSYQSGGSTYQQDKASTFSFGLGGFYRNYFKGGSTFLPFGQIGLNFGMSTQHTEGFFHNTTYRQTYDGKSSGGFFGNASLILGMTKMVSPHTGLDFSAGYNFSYNKYTYKTTTQRDDGNNGSIDITTESNPTNKFTNHGFILGVGFQIFLDARK